MTTIPAGNKHDELRGHLVTLYAEAVSQPRPPDHCVGAYLRQHKEIRGGARGFLAATLFSLLRRRGSVLIAEALRACKDFSGHEPAITELTSAIDPVTEAALAHLRWLAEDMGAASADAIELTRSAAAVASISLDGIPLEDFLRFLGGVDEDALPPALRVCLRTGLPPVLARRWIDRYGEAETMELGRACLKPAPLDLRIDVRELSREEVIARLEEASIPAELCPFAPSGVRLLRKANLNQVAALPPEAFEVQDEGSQLVAEAIGRDVSGRILDACAGGGGKTINLAAISGTEVFAWDTDIERLSRLEKRIPARDAERVHLVGPEGPASHGPYDAVLIDAPCLGLGRLRRDPTVAWHGELDDRLEEITELQRACLASYAPMVRPGGVLVYATCSFEPEETSGMIDWFLNEFSDFKPDVLPALFQSASLGECLYRERSEAILLPHQQGTDGFYIARLRRMIS